MARINIRQKGANGEREIAKILNEAVDRVRLEHKLSIPAKEDEPFQRNQNQSAVGGDDLTNPFGLSIEVKRQENLSVNAWWGQTINSASRFDGIPILLFKQNRKKWRCVMLVKIDLESSAIHRLGENLSLTTRAEIDIETFVKWFEGFYSLWLESKGHKKPK